jgi:hypothetical protein
LTLGAVVVVLGRVELKFSEEFAVVGEDPDMELVDQDQDVGAGVAAADAAVVGPAVVAQGEGSAGVALVVADAVVGSSRGRPVGTALGRAWEAWMGVRRPRARWGRLVL